jgi:hypothetical protein
LFADLPGGGLADVPAHGDAGHIHDEQLAQMRFKV